ncbi:MAG: hypothetical protein K9I36_09135 [Bacteroidia bacterium]|nr:hypothetical protein [Bacteroidia bacterium]MCF8426882.1 hypothetical protein [Bacteroidia bacterium]
MITTYKYLTPVSIERTRYFTDPAFDTIKFKSNKGDTLIFVKTDCDSVWFDEYKSWNNPACGPYENVKNLQITNTYKTIKGEGIFKVKHSVSIGNYQEYVIEIFFQMHHFYFYEINFNAKFYSLYFGDFVLGNKAFSQVFYAYPDYINIETKGYMAPDFGLIAVFESSDSTMYETLN